MGLAAKTTQEKGKTIDALAHKLGARETEDLPRPIGVERDALRAQARHRGKGAGAVVQFQQKVSTALRCHLILLSWVP
jgi:hypothetical protein